MLRLFAVTLAVGICVVLFAPPVYADLAGVRNCRTKFIDAAKNARGVELFDTDTTDLWIEAATASQLRPISSQMSKCLDTAFPQKSVVRGAKTGIKAVLWSNKVGAEYIWCSTTLDGVMGPSGGLKNYAALFVCARSTDLPICVPGVFC